MTTEIEARFVERAEVLIGRIELHEDSKLELLGIIRSLASMSRSNRHDDYDNNCTCGCWDEYNDITNDS